MILELPHHDLPGHVELVYVISRVLFSQPLNICPKVVHNVRRNQCQRLEDLQGATHRYF